MGFSELEGVDGYVRLLAGRGGKGMDSNGPLSFSLSGHGRNHLHYDRYSKRAIKSSDLMPLKFNHYQTFKKPLSCLSFYLT